VQFIALGMAAAAVAAVAAAYALTHSGAGQSAMSAAARTRVNGPSAARGQALRILSVTPQAGAGHANGGEPVELKFSVPLAAGSPTPTVRPAVPGRWTVAGNAMTFIPAGGFPPASTVTVRVPGGRHGVRAATGRVLARTTIARFRTGRYRVLRLNQMLAELGYLPLTWAPVPGMGAQNGTPGGAAAQPGLAYSPPAGRFTWNRGYPAALHRLWRPAARSVIERGAVMAFQWQHRMPINGVVGTTLWRALFLATALDQSNGHGYTYALASQKTPETLTIWHNGRKVLRSLANTGIPVSPTANGTFPVYLRYRFQIMRGTNPDGSQYADPVSFVSYFNGGDAVHYFPRGSYGFQQSLGCVELPYGAAEQAWPYLSYGSLVTVTG
jgi:L,D-transpeptidase catalytic domain